MSGLTINTPEEGDMANVTVDRRLWLTADKSELVEDGDPAASFLWAVEGREVPKEEADRYGYEPSDEPRPEGQDEPVAEPETEPQGEEAESNVCPECGFEAKSSGGLAAHQRSHEDGEG